MNPVRKRLILVAAAAMALVVSGPVTFGQAQRPPAPAVSSKVTLTMEQRHVIKEFIKERKVASEPSNVQVAVGEVIPKTVRLQTMPADVAQKVSQVRNYSFFLKNEQLVLVDPKDNKVVDVIEMQ
jgi:hypothetical protein